MAEALFTHTLPAHTRFSTLHYLITLFACVVSSSHTLRLVYLLVARAFIAAHFIAPRTLVLTASVRRMRSVKKERANREKKSNTHSSVEKRKKTQHTLSEQSRSFDYAKKLFRSLPYRHYSAATLSGCTCLGFCCSVCLFVHDRAYTRLDTPRFSFSSSPSLFLSACRSLQRTTAERNRISREHRYACRADHRVDRVLRLSRATSDALIVK